MLNHVIAYARLGGPPIIVIQPRKPIFIVGHFSLACYLKPKNNLGDLTEMFSNYHFSQPTWSLLSIALHLPSTLTKNGKFKKKLPQTKKKNKANYY